MTETQDTAPAPAEPPAPALRTRDLSFRWQPDQPRLRFPDLELPRGEHLFLQGASGSGKSTLLGLICGLQRPDTGQIQVLDQDLGQLRRGALDRFRANHLGIIFQQFNLVPYLSALANVTLPCRFSAARRRVALESSPDLDQEAVRLLTQLELDVGALAGRPVTELSAGQQQRVAVARALIGAPSLVIADEPTSALDADARHAFLDLLFREVEAAKATLIFVSHDRDLGARFDRAVALADINRAA